VDEADGHHGVASLLEEELENLGEERVTVGRKSSFSGTVIHIN